MLTNVPLLIGLLFSTLPALATCIVIKRTDTHIYIGADSKSIRHDLLPDGSSVPVEILNKCKIVKAGNYYFAISGSVSETLHHVATQACLKAKSIDEIKDLLYLNANYTLYGYLEYLRKTNPKDYADSFAEKHLGDITFFCIENKIPQVLTINVGLANKAVEQTDLQGRFIKNQEYTILGYHEKLGEPGGTQERIKQLMQTNPIQGIKEIIEFEMKLYPGAVGGPIDLLTLSNDGGVKWDAKKEKCYQYPPFVKKKP